MLLHFQSRLKNKTSISCTPLQYVYCIYRISVYWIHSQRYTSSKRVTLSTCCTDLQKSFTSILIKCQPNRKRLLFHTHLSNVPCMVWGKYEFMRCHSSDEYFMLAVMLPQPADNQTLLLPDHRGMNPAVTPALPIPNCFQTSSPHSVSRGHTHAAGFTLAKGQLHAGRGFISTSPPCWNTQTFSAASPSLRYDNRI